VDFSGLSAVKQLEQKCPDRINKNSSITDQRLREYGYAQLQAP